MTTATPPNRSEAANLSDIAWALRILCEPGAVTELRVLGMPRVKVAAGYFDDFDLLVKAAEHWSGRAKGVYITLNRVNPALLARAHNQVVEGLSPTTADTDIIWRTRLLIDCDARRPAGISASDAEHQAALERASLIREALIAEGFPPMLLGDSGNGAHLILGLDLPNTPAMRTLLERVLQALELRFGDEVVAVDTSVFNAARISKLYGTLAAKGDATPDRPHRLARIIESPDVLQPVPLDLLERLVAVVPDDAGAPPRGRTPGDHAWDGTAGTGFDLDEWIARHGIRIARTGSWQEGRKLVLEACVWDPSHTDGAAFIVQFPSGAIAAGCLHNSCRSKRWQDFRALFEPDHERLQDSPGSSSTPEPGPRTRPERPWPAPPDPIVYRGLAGQVVEAIMPHTEADPVAVLINLLVAFGNEVGDGPHMLVGATKHPAREFAVLVGRTGKARKGESWNPVRVLLEQAAPDWASTRIASGMSTGEGLIHEVRDPVAKQEPIKEKGRITGYQTVIADAGESDKRLLVIEPELARPLRAMSRQGNTLESVLRDAWDRGTLRVMTRTNPLHATGAHISVIGHVTVAELQRENADVSIANGFANRLAWLCVHRSKDLPEPVPFAGEVVQPLAGRLAVALGRARAIGVMERDAEAREVWRQVYSDLAAEREGLAGALAARAEAHVLRLSLIYALLDGSSVVTADHLLAALALWEYVEASVAYIFGDATGDPIADTILAALRQHGELSRTQISDLFGRNASSDRIARALQALLGLGKARMEQRETGGRPREVWVAC